MNNIENFVEDLGLWQILSSEFGNCETMCGILSYLMSEGGEKDFCRIELKLK